MSNNVLLLIADQFRYDCQGYTGMTPVKTPNIDALSEDSVTFDNAYTSIPTCCPARQSFYACKRSESFGAYWNHGITMPVKSLSPEDYSFVRDFEKAGYNTVYVGRSEINPEHDCTEYGYKSHRNTIVEYAHKYCEPAITQRYHDGWVEKGDMNSTPTAYTAMAAIEELDKSGDQAPFFMTVCFTSPHPPYRPHEHFYNMYDSAEKWKNFQEDFISKPYIQKQMVYNWYNENQTWDDWEPVVRKYYAQITELDYYIGKIVAYLKENGKYDNTTIVFTADHGDTCGAHKMFDKHYILYEEVTHVPLVIKSSNSLAFSPVKGRTKEYTTHNLDLGPTLMEINDIKCSATGLHGKSLSDVLKGGKSERNEVVSTFNGAQFGLYTMRCIKNDRWKYIWQPAGIDELYDLESDPYELKNMIYEDDKKDIISELRKKLFDILIKEEDPFCTVGKSWAAKRQLIDNNKV